MKILNKILGPQMISNEKVVIYKAVDMFMKYNYRRSAPLNRTLLTFAMASLLYNLLFFSLCDT